MSWVGEIAEKIRGREAERKCYAALPVIGAADDAPEIDTGGYIEVRLAEMSLHYEREYWINMEPVLVSATSFEYDGEFQVDTRVVSAKTIKGVSVPLKAEIVEQRNVALAGPVPYCGGKVGLFVGLFAVPRSDLVDTLLGVVEGVSGETSVGGLSTYLPVCRAVNDGVKHLLGIKEIKLQIGIYEGFSSAEGGKGLRSCYLAGVNRKEDRTFIEKLAVKDNRLGQRTDNEIFHNLVNYDFYLIKFHRRARRGSYTSLPFHKRWSEVLQLLTAGNLQGAAEGMLRLNAELASCPDITWDDRTDLLTSYTVKYNKEKAMVEELGRNLGLTKGGLETQESPGQRGTMRARAISKITGLAEKVDKDGGVHMSDPLLNVAEHWSDFLAIGEQPKDDQTQDDRIDEELNVLRRWRGNANPDPAAYARALSSAMINTL